MYKWSWIVAMQCKSEDIKAPLFEPSCIWRFESARSNPGLLSARDRVGRELVAISRVEHGLSEIMRAYDTFENAAKESALKLVLDNVSD